MGSDVLAIDVGTTVFKLAVYDQDLKQKCQVLIPYEANLHERTWADIEPDKWWQALRQACASAASHLGDVGVLSLSVTTPGLTAMAADGAALGAAVLFYDGRSHAQAREIRQQVGDDYFLEQACNLPVSGGSSLSSILWIKEHQPEVWNATAKFGHTNTYMVKRLTGEWAIDPSTVSITGLYNTARDDLTWNDRVLDAAGIAPRLLPPLLRSHEPVGAILPAVADELGLPRGVVVLIGGNDAVLAALSAGVTEPGQIISQIGTAEITYVCVDHPLSSPNFNLRCHVVPKRWLTFFVLNAGGMAFEWFRSVFCSELSDDEFYKAYLPGAIRRFFGNPDLAEAESQLPQYGPFLGGSRYSLEQQWGHFDRLDVRTTRDDMLLALVRGCAAYSGSHLLEVGGMVPLSRKVLTAGTGARIDGLMQARKRWFGDYEFEFRDQSSLLGAAMLGQSGFALSHEGLGAAPTPR